MSMPLNINIRLRLNNQPGTLARVLTIVAKEKGSLGAIELVSASPSYIIRDLMIRLRDRRHLGDIIGALDALPDVEIIHVADRVVMKHLGGKIEVSSTRPIQNWEDLALVYTPGVAGVSEAIAQDPDMVYKLTMKGNSVAIVTDGSAILGLGNLGPAAALPVMEGKAVLFKRFANINAFPLCLDVHEPEQIIEAVAAIAPSFGGINLEDIAAPKCFEIEEKLANMLDIPVFHDDQHGTAIVTLAGLLNALKVVNKNIQDVQVVISGAGAAGVAITRLLQKAGVKHIIVCDRKGAIARDNMPTVNSKKWIAENTNEECRHGSPKEVLTGADVFVGVSAPRLLNRDDIMKMAERPVVFALANPDPEVEPEEIFDIAGVIATGRSDYPNQINNALAFPGLFRGALNCHARTINDEMCLAAAYALAGIVKDEQLTADNIIPSIFNDVVAPTVAKAVEKAAEQTGVSRSILNGKEKEFDSLL
ncbi:NAD-dependent malic enzyme [Pelotomaculum schinkii]|uniref:NAD-dependent malic enzyme n=1 Tax=Pelotomaculum schinkii TaxID=78350 RepID=A0A4Y7RDL2_9FIRM|nr:MULTISPECIES: NAD-dependent malic enzyme [Pelotomaculum]TEB07084.1 NAD-dependent malic enzyme [Pelotomaculum schinkii]TEB17003.1 NAD-dependent malic enzyme [Pelotomaculum sp. FP]